MPQLLGIKDGSRRSDVEATRVSGRKWKDVKTFSQTYIVLADNTTQDESDIASTSGVPPKFYPLAGCYCVAHRAVEVQTIVHPITGVMAILWEVTADFTSDVNPDEDAPPEARRPKVRWTGETEEETLERDVVTGAAIQTANYERILVNGPVTVPVLTVTRWEFYPFNPLTILLFSNRVNSTPFYGAPAGTALMLPMEAGDSERIPVGSTSYEYVPVTYTIKFKLRPDPANPSQLLADPWKSRVLHQGYMVRATAGAAPKVHVDANGRPSPVNLNADGTENTSGTPYFLEFNRHAYADLNALSLGPF